MELHGLIQPLLAPPLSDISGPAPSPAPPGPIPILASQIPFCKPQLQILIPLHSCTDGRVAPSCLTCIDHCSNGGSCTMNSKMMPECQ